MLCWLVNVGFFMEQEQLDYDFMEECVKPLALVFKPYYTEFHAYDDLHDLIASFDISIDNMFMMLLPEPVGPVTHVCVFVGRKSRTALENLAGFVEYNGLQVAAGAAITWCTDVAVAVGYHDVSQTVYDLPMSTFPWILSFFCCEDNPSIFQAAFAEVTPPAHKTASSCERCSRLKVPCVAMQGMRCKRCVWAGKGCVPGRGEDNARSRNCLEALIDVAYALGPRFRMLMHMVKLRHGYEGAPRMNYYGHSVLKTVVDREHPPHWDSHAEHLILINCGSFQVVQFQHGMLHLRQEQSMHLIFGFVDQSKQRHKRMRVACIAPHLGLERSELAFSLIDNALSRPGQIFYMTANILTKQWTVQLGRIFLVCGYRSPDDVSFTIGWQF